MNHLSVFGKRVGQSGRFRPLLEKGMEPSGRFPGVEGSPGGYQRESSTFCVFFKVKNV